MHVRISREQGTERLRIMGNPSSISQQNPCNHTGTGKTRVYQVRVPAYGGCDSAAGDASMSFLPMRTAAALTRGRARSGSEGLFQAGRPSASASLTSNHLCRPRLGQPNSVRMPTSRTGTRPHPNYSAISLLSVRFYWSRLVRIGTGMEL